MLAHEAFRVMLYHSVFMYPNLQLYKKCTIIEKCLTDINSSFKYTDEYGVITANTLQM